MNTLTHSEPIAVTRDTFDSEVIAASRHQPVIVDFWAAWCGPCKALAPILHEVAAERAGQVTIAKADVDAEPELTARFGVRSIPTLLVFREGRVVDTLVGVHAKAQILAHLDRATAA